jgi:DNA-binding NarL/FixJ family response regulator
MVSIDYYLAGGVIACVLLVGLWILRSIADLKRTYSQCGPTHDDAYPTSQDHDAQHRALVYLLNQKTDSILAALARTIEQERQKLGVVVRNPSMAQAIDALQPPEKEASEDSHLSNERILTMAADGISVATIARQLHVPEAEVSMVVRLNAA